MKISFKNPRKVGQIYRPLLEQFSYTLRKFHLTESLFFHTNDKLLPIPSGSMKELEEFLLGIFKLSKLFIIYPLPQRRVMLSCTGLKTFQDFSGFCCWKVATHVGDAGDVFGQWLQKNRQKRLLRKVFQKDFKHIKNRLFCN